MQHIIIAKNEQGSVGYGLGKAITVVEPNKLLKALNIFQPKKVKTHTDVAIKMAGDDGKPITKYYTIHFLRGVNTQKLKEVTIKDGNKVVNYLYGMWDGVYEIDIMRGR